jgi:hypothetical protein
VARARILGWDGWRADERCGAQAEALLNKRNQLEAMEILQLMCQLLEGRVNHIAAEKTFPDDLTESAASIIYAAKRVQIDEFTDVAKLLGAKFGEEWVRRHIDNDSERVRPNIVAKLSVAPPSFADVTKALTECAEAFEVDWTPPAPVSGVERLSNTQALGSIAPAPDARGAAAAAAAAASVMAGPAGFVSGALAVTVHQARNLYDTQLVGKQDPYVALRLLGVPNTEFRTHVHKSGDRRAEFKEEHFTFVIKSPGLTLQLEAFNSNAISDDFIGRCNVDVDRLIRTDGPRWYPLSRKVSGGDDGGEVQVTARFMPFDPAAPRPAPVAAAAAADEPSAPRGFVASFVAPGGPTDAYGNPVAAASAAAGPAASTVASAPPPPPPPFEAVAQGEEGPALDDLEARFRRLQG